MIEHVALAQLTEHCMIARFTCRPRYHRHCHEILCLRNIICSAKCSTISGKSSCLGDLARVGVGKKREGGGGEFCPFTQSLYCIISLVIILSIDFIILILHH